MSHCPDRDLLGRHLEDGLVDTELDQHVKGCPSCQQALEELTDDTTWTPELRRSRLGREDRWRHEEQVSVLFFC
jgi:hypothetical protein